MQKELFYKQLDYELWANKMVIKAISEAVAPEIRAIEIVSHLVISSANWLTRITGESAAYKPWTLLTLPACLELSVQNHRGWIRYFENATTEEVKKQFSFSFMNQLSNITIEDLFIHLINHSSYHRGQIIAQLKGRLDPLPLTTYIAYAAVKN